MQVQIINNNNNQPSFSGVVFKNKSLYARYGRGIVGQIRKNPVVDSFKHRDDYDMVFSAARSKTAAEFYWQIKRKKVSDPLELIKNLFAPKVYFEHTRFSSIPSADTITAKRVDEYIADNLL